MAWRTVLTYRMGWPRVRAERRSYPLVDVCDDLTLQGADGGPVCGGEVACHSKQEPILSSSRHGTRPGTQSSLRLPARARRWWMLRLTECTQPQKGASLACTVSPSDSCVSRLSAA
nr:MAG TPA: hypothetical protein [Caudoviricetes sp.]